MTVHDYISDLCSLTLFAELSEESEYWAKAFKFFEENEMRSVHDLTPAQREWLRKIKDGLIDEAGK